MKMGEAINHSDEEEESALNIVASIIDMVLEESTHPGPHGDHFSNANIKFSSIEKVEAPSPRFLYKRRIIK